MSKYQIILWDLDGTLTDSHLGITKSVQYALEKLNIRVDNLEALRKFIGPPLLESFQKFYGFDEEQAKEAVAIYREYFADKGLYENEVYEGIPELLQELQNRGKNLYVATSKPTIFARKILEHFKLEQYFDDIVGSNLDGTQTDKTEIIAKIMAGLSGIDKQRVIMVGDREHDVIGARNNGIPAVIIKHGYGTEDEITMAAPTYYVNDICQLGEILGV